MSLENLADPTGSEINIEGVPYREVLSEREIRRGMFWRWRLGQQPEVREPQLPLPDNLPVIEPEPVEPQKKVRGRPFQKGWNKPGI